MSQLTVIKNAQIVLETGILFDGVLVLCNGKIVDFGRSTEIERPTGATHIDAKGAYVGPGFVDIHVHGGGGFSTCFEAARAARHFLEHGETSILATTDYSMPLETVLSAIGTVKASLADAPTVRGIYMEGPYTNPRYGCNAHCNPWRHPIDPVEYTQIVDAAGTFVRVWTVAPEREGLAPFLAYARKVNPTVRFAVGHSEATPAQIRAMGSVYRPSILTHAMNATGQLPVEEGTRAVGPDEYFMCDEGSYAEMICDSLAIHVKPEMQRLLLRTKGIGRMILITDSTHFANESPARFAHIDDLNFNERGELAGSKMTMDQACRNMMRHTDCGIAQAFRMASLNPARAVGLDAERGSIERGKIADLVFVDDHFNVQAVMLCGQLC